MGVRMNRATRASRWVKAPHIIFTIISLTVLSLGLCAQGPANPGLRERLRLRLEASGDGAGEDWILSRRALPAFYEGRGYQTAWVTDAGAAPLVEELIGAIERVSAEGLKPEDYHLSRIRELYGRLRSGSTPASQRTGILTELELRASDAFLMLASHLVAGRTNPEDAAGGVDCGTPGSRSGAPVAGGVGDRPRGADAREPDAGLPGLRASEAGPGEVRADRPHRRMAGNRRGTEAGSGDFRPARGGVAGAFGRNRRAGRRAGPAAPSSTRFSKRR